VCVGATAEGTGIDNTKGKTQRMLLVDGGNCMCRLFLYAILKSKTNMKNRYDDKDNKVLS